jgi:hypothetical protein
VNEQNSTDGFTLMQLLLAMVVITAVAAVAAPSLASRGIAAEEAVAVRTLREIFAAQNALMSRQTVDGDRDGNSEYGYFQELAAAKASRVDLNGNGVTNRVGTRRGLATLPAEFGRLDADGLVHRGGYVFRMALPGALHAWAWEIADPDRYPRVIANYAESCWGCYAWPERYGETGRRAFFVNQSGEILASSNERTRYSGGANPPPGHAAILAGTQNWSMNGIFATNSTGVDQSVWTTVD